MTDTLVMNDITKRFGTRKAPIWALAGVSLSVGIGETLGVVGESGSGKSTLARIAVGLEAATTGEARLMGEPISSHSVVGRAQMVFQDPGSSLDPLLRIQRSVMEPLEQTPDTPRMWRSRAADILSEVGLSGAFRERRPAEMSGGQKQRASIARALAALPPFLVCDEAVTALDVSVRAQILNLLRRIQKHNTTSLLFISHDLCTVAYMSDRIAVMYLGKVVEIGPSRSVFTAPGHPYGWALLSAVPALQQGSAAIPRIRLQGDPPSVARPPSGCRFHTRCPLAVERCAAEEPLPREVGEGHQVACHFAPVPHAAMQAAAKREAA